MGVQWPTKIDLHFRAKGSGVSGILVIVQLNSRVKNNFSIGPLLIDEAGSLSLKSDDLRETIEREKREYPMDYDGTLEDCDGFDVLVENEAELLGRVQRLMKYYPEAAANLNEKLKGANNKKYASFRGHWEIPIGSKEVVVDLVEI